MRLDAQRPSERFAARALKTSESARARSLVELLAEARADIRQGVSSALLERERSLQELLDSKAQAQMQVLTGRHTAEQAAEATQEIDRVAAEYELVKADIRRSSPRYAALTQPVPLAVEDIQKRVLDD